MFGVRLPWLFRAVFTPRCLLLCALGIRTLVSHVLWEEPQHWLSRTGSTLRFGGHRSCDALQLVFKPISVAERTIPIVVFVYGPSVRGSRSGLPLGAFPVRAVLRAMVVVVACRSCTGVDAMVGVAFCAMAFASSIVLTRAAARGVVGQPLALRVLVLAPISTCRGAQSVAPRNTAPSLASSSGRIRPRAPTRAWFRRWCWTRVVGG